MPTAELLLLLVFLPFIRSLHGSNRLGQRMRPWRRLLFPLLRARTIGLQCGPVHRLIFGRSLRLGSSLRLPDSRFRRSVAGVVSAIGLSEPAEPVLQLRGMRRLLGHDRLSRRLLPE